MPDLGNATLARRYYLHVLNGGTLTAEDVSRLVTIIEELETKLSSQEGVK